MYQFEIFCDGKINLEYSLRDPNSEGFFWACQFWSFGVVILTTNDIVTCV